MTPTLQEAARLLRDVLEKIRERESNVDQRWSDLAERITIFLANIPLGEGDTYRVWIGVETFDDDDNEINVDLGFPHSAEFDDEDEAVMFATHLHEFATAMNNLLEAFS